MAKAIFLFSLLLLAGCINQQYNYDDEKPFDPCDHLEIYNVYSERLEVYTSQWCPGARGRVFFFYKGADGNYQHADNCSIRSEIFGKLTKLEEKGLYTFDFRAPNRRDQYAWTVECQEGELNSVANTMINVCGGCVE